MKIFVLNDGPGLGDFIHKGLFFMFDLHLKYKLKTTNWKV